MRATPQERVQVELDRARTDMEEARQDYVRACESLAAEFSRAADHARTRDKNFGFIVSGTVVGNSLIQDVPRFSARFQMAKDIVERLKDLAYEVTP